MAEDGDDRTETPIFRDIRRYTCQFCGITRSKKTLITSHINANHQDQIDGDCDGDDGGVKMNVCEECGVGFRKPAHLKQHMQSHSLERKFVCPVNDCSSSYRRQDHLNRHLLRHQGKLFDCPIENCKSKFSFQGNVTRHVKEFHEDMTSSTPSDPEVPKQYVCPEPGCGKVFKYASKLRKHEDSHVKLNTLEALCSEPGCMKYFTNEQCLKVHIQSCHQHITCEVCGTKHLKKNIKRHLRSHEELDSSERIKCDFDGCLHTFASKSNLQQHIKAVHFEEKPFACGFPGCGMRFSFKHVRDKHEKSALHTFTPGDFVETDEQFHMRPRGGRKRTLPTIENFMRNKRVVAPSYWSNSE